jgi:hypothetical protein
MEFGILWPATKTLDPAALEIAAVLRASVKADGAPSR